MLSGRLTQKICTAGDIIKVNSSVRLAHGTEKNVWVCKDECSEKQHRGHRFAPTGTHTISHILLDSTFNCAFHSSETLNRKK